MFALQMIVTSAGPAGIDVIDAPCFDLRNPDLLRRESLQGRRLGFDGKGALHPDQIAIIREASMSLRRELPGPKRSWRN